MNIGRILFFAIFLLSSTTLLATTTILNSVNFSQAFNQPVAGLQERLLATEYQQALIQLLQSYSAEEKMKNFSEGVGSLENDLLGLTTPAKYQDLHFKLITSLDRVKPGTAQAMQATRTSLESLIKDYSWLASTLSLFIINNFS